MAAEDEVSAVQRVAEHCSLVDEDVLDRPRSVVRRTRAAVGSRARKECPPPHKTLFVMRHRRYFADYHDTRNSPKVRPHLVSNERMEKETAENADHDVPHQNAV